MTTGASLWSVPAEREHPWPAYENGRVFVAYADGLAAHDAVTGALLWRHTRAASAARPPTVDGGTVYTASPARSRPWTRPQAPCAGHGPARAPAAAPRRSMRPACSRMAPVRPWTAPRASCSAAPTGTAASTRWSCRRSSAARSSRAGPRPGVRRRPPRVRRQRRIERDPAGDARERGRVRVEDGLRAYTLPGWSPRWRLTEGFPYPLAAPPLIVGTHRDLAQHIRLSSARTTSTRELACGANARATISRSTRMTARPRSPSEKV